MIFDTNNFPWSGSIRTTSSQNLQDLICDAGKELFVRCSSFSKLFFHLKCFYGCSNKLFNVIFELLNLSLPLGVGLPKSTYENKKFIGD